MAKKADEFERNLERLRTIVAGLERGDLALESGVALFKEGLGLAKACSAQLKKARQDVTLAADGLIKEFEAFRAEEAQGAERETAQDAGDEE
jgi:exodeoxyribonuclease VII small subunit